MRMMIQGNNITTYLLGFGIGMVVLLVAGVAEAATLSVSPGTGVYSAGGTFTARVVINTAGEPVNAAEGQLSFNPRELSVVGVSRGSSIFNLWTQEPSFSNTAGTISFGGGSPTGYTGSAGTVMTVTFRALNAGSPKITFTQGSVLAANGLGTNVLTAMNGASYTVSSPVANPEPEYIAPANTPKAPQISSATHPDQDGWYTNTSIDFAWDLPADVTSVRTLLDSNPGTIPTKVYDSPIDSISIEDLDEGVSYFHIQFRNGNGWGKVAHFRIGVDSKSPSSFTITQPEDVDLSNPEQQLEFNVEDDTSPVTKFLIQIDGGEAIEYIDKEETGLYTLSALDPGRHAIVVEAFDGAGNSIVGSYTFDIASFEKPIFTEYPSRFNNEVIPVFTGSTRPNAKVSIDVRMAGGNTETYEVVSDENGVFRFIPDGRFGIGVYDLSAIAVDEYGAKSDPSESIRVIVDEPGYIKIGSFFISILSIAIPTLALVLLLIFGLWYLWHLLSVWRRKVRKEAIEAEEKLKLEFDEITANLAANVTKLKKSRKGKLTKAEEALIDELSSDIADARVKIKKEIEDIENIVQ